MERHDQQTDDWHRHGTGRERGRANLRPPWKKGQSGNPLGPRKRVNLQKAIDAYMRGSVETVTEIPERVMDLIASVERAAHKDPGMLREFLLRWQGHVPKEAAVELPRPTIIVQQVSVGSSSQAPALQAPEPERLAASVPDSTTLQGPRVVESITVSSEPPKRRYLPILGSPEPVQDPDRPDLDDDEAI